MSRKLIEKGHSVTMVCLSRKDGNTGLNQPFVKGRREGIVDGILVIEIELLYSNYQNLIRRAWVFLKFAFLNIKIVFTEEYDVIFATSTPLTAGIPGIVAKIFRRKPFVFEVRDLWPELPKSMGIIRNPLVLFSMSILEWLSYHCADKVIALAPGIVDGIVRRGISQTRVTLIPNGSDLELFSEKRIPKKIPGIQKGDFVAIFTGAHGIANGLYALIDVARELKNNNIENIKLLLIGDGKEKPGLMRTANELKLDNIIFKDPIPKSKMPELLNMVDTGMMILDNIPAFYNGTSPNKFFDYIAAGLPVINNYPGWLAELIKEFRCGFPTEPGNPGLFVEKLVLMEGDKDLVAEMRKNSRKLAVEKFDRNIQAVSFIDCLESVGKHGVAE